MPARTRVAAAYAPELHLRHVEPGGMFATYAGSFERVWTDTTPLNAPAPA